MKKQVAILGMGDIYATHLAALAQTQNAQLVAVCDIDPAASARAPEGVPFYTDCDAMLAAHTLDCVHICLPHYLHYPMAKKLIEQGIHVFCEKPVALNTAQALEFAALEAEHPEMYLGICLQNRRNETNEMLKEIIDSGKYGKPVACRGMVPWFRPKEYYDVKPWRGTWEKAGGGCMINQSVHTLDLLHFFFGEIESLRGSAAQLLDYGIEVEDTVNANIAFKNGATGFFWATNANHTNESVSIQVTLEQASFLVVDSILYQLDEAGNRTQLCEDTKLPGRKFYYGASHARLIDEFYQSMQDGTRNYIQVKDAVMSIRLIDAVVNSHKNNKTIYF